ncbi:MAG TPA: AAA family ATPase [Polyangiaceae bacterium]|nr:AAA family ATPase [Polyangiaceae bacterium]
MSADPTRRSSSPPARLFAWKGTGRYEIVRTIGRGGMGVVYEAIDHERRQRVALKTLLNFDPHTLYRFKNEFRTLADVRHRNLVRLYEFVMTEGDHVFFTMELVRGANFRAFASRPGAIDEAKRSRTSAPPTRRSPVPPRPSDAPPPSKASPEPACQSPADIGRLRTALLGLAEGTQVLHAAGKLHRDIKPSNILVTSDGRVVLLDFGVATELGAAIGGEDTSGEMVGTAHYMAPEQAFDERLTAASDWYSAGVVLYEALVGRPPFVGSAAEVIQQKSMMEAFPPSSLVHGVPDDLDVLCRSLLQRDPSLRPTGPEILRQLRSIGGASAPMSVPPSAESVFVGRESQLEVLRAAFDRVAGGRPTTVRVAGTSGMGKSTLVQHFLDDLTDSGRAVVLRGRAYERESVPYKAVDSVIDALTRQLLRLADTSSLPALPPGIGALARLFPVLRRVPGIESCDEGQPADPRELRRRAFGALRDLLAALAHQAPLVVYIDDVQWGDVDSAALLLDLMRPPRPPPVLLVMTYRDNEAHASSFLAELKAGWPAEAEVVDVDVGPLDAGDAQRLAVTLLDAHDEVGQRIARAAARESRGSPFLIGELVRANAATTSTDEDTLRVLTVEHMVAGRLQRLPGDARKLLEIVAVGGRPLPVSVAADAAQIRDNVEDVVALAVSRRFLRAGLRGGVDVVEMSHDRIREAIVEGLSPAELRARHRRLADVLEWTVEGDLEALAGHLRGAGDLERAVKHAERAAERAAAKLAFDQAARLYRTALDATPPSSPEAGRLHLELARVLEWAGRGADAAAVYLRAANDAAITQRAEIERAAAEQLLTSGRIDEGVAVLDRTLASVGLARPRSAVHAIFLLLFYRLCIRLKSRRFEDALAAGPGTGDRAQIDALYAAGIGLSLVDSVQAACLQARGLLLALRAGDRFQVVRAAAIEAATHASAGGALGDQERKLDAIAQRLADAMQHPEGRAFLVGTRGVGLFLRGQWRKALEEQDRAYAEYPNNRAGWQANGHLFSMWALTWLGRLREFRERHARLFADAERRGDLYTTVNLRIGYSNLAYLVVDDVEAARRHVEGAMAAWSRRGYHLQHYRAMLADANIELYAGRARAAHDRIVSDWKALGRSFLFRVQYVRVDARFARARAAVATAAAGDDVDARLTEAERLARSLARERMGWTEPLASLVEAGIASVRGEDVRAATFLRAAIEQSDAADMGMHAAAGRYALGSMVAGDEGKALRSRGEGAMAGEGIAVPARFAVMLVPGKWEGRSGE